MGPRNQPVGAMPVARILEQASRLFGVPIADIVGAGRMRRFSRPRQAVMLAGYECGWSAHHVAKMLGRTDHTTVLHGRDQALAWAERDPLYKQRIEGLRLFASQHATAPYLGETGAPIPIRAVPEPVAVEPEPEPAPEQPSWCAQCERLVLTAEALRCRSRFCKWKVAA